MMTYGSSNYLRIVFMFKQNSKSDGDDQSVNRKGQPNCMPVLHENFFTKRQPKLNSLGFNELNILGSLFLFKKTSQIIRY
jgi:hypothetical protein